MATDLMQLRVDECLINGASVECSDFSVERNTEYVDVGTCSKPDPEWSFTDAAGHFHAYDKDGHVPPIEPVIIESYYCEDCRDEHDEYQRQCLLCHEHIKPGTKSLWGKRIPGQTTTTHTIEVVGQVSPGDRVSVVVRVQGLEWFGILRSSGTTFRAGNELTRTTYRTTYTGALYERMKAK